MVDNHKFTRVPSASRSHHSQHTAHQNHITTSVSTTIMSDILILQPKQGSPTNVPAKAPAGTRSIEYYGLDSVDPVKHVEMVTTAGLTGHRYEGFLDWSLGTRMTTSQIWTCSVLNRREMIGHCSRRDNGCS